MANRILGKHVGIDLSKLTATEEILAFSSSVRLLIILYTRAQLFLTYWPQEHEGRVDAKQQSDCLFGSTGQYPKIH